MTSEKARLLRAWGIWILRWFGTLCCGLLIFCWMLGQWFWMNVRPGDYLDVVACGGTIGVDLFLAGPTGPPGFEIRPAPAMTAVHRLGIHLPFCQRPNAWIWAVDLPMWLCLTATGLPTVWLWRLREPPAPGHCTRCGYDLTGNVSGRCPECGRRVPRAE